MFFKLSSTNKKSTSRHPSDPAPISKIPESLPLTSTAKKKERSQSLAVGKNYPPLPISEEARRHVSFSPLAKTAETENETAMHHQHHRDRLSSTSSNKSGSEAASPISSGFISNSSTIEDFPQQKRLPPVPPPSPCSFSESDNDDDDAFADATSDIDNLLGPKRPSPKRRQRSFAAFTPARDFISVPAGLVRDLITLQMSTLATMLSDKSISRFVSRFGPPSGSQQIQPSPRLEGHRQIKKQSLSVGSGAPPTSAPRPSRQSLSAVYMVNESLECSSDTEVQQSHKKEKGKMKEKKISQCRIVELSSAPPYLYLFPIIYCL